jgi:hypothetical protein
MHLVLRADLGVHASGCILRHLFHLGQDFILEIVLSIGNGIEVVLVLRIRYFIVGLVLAIFGVLLLDGVVGQMDLWLEVVDVEEVGGCPYVTFLVPVCSGHSIEVGDQHVVPDVEFAVEV